MEDERYFIRLNDPDAQWLEQRDHAIDTTERFELLTVALETLDGPNAPGAAGVSTLTESGTVLRLDLRDDGKIVVKVLGSRGGIKAAFSFRPNDTARSGEQPRLADLAWEPDLVDAAAQESIERGFLAGSIDQLDLNERHKARLRNHGDVHTVAELVALTDEELHAIRYLGKTGRTAVDAALAKYGLRRKK